MHEKGNDSHFYYLYSILYMNLPIQTELNHWNILHSFFWTLNNMLLKQEFSEIQQEIHDKSAFKFYIISGISFQCSFMNL